MVSKWSEEAIAKAKQEAKEIPKNVSERETGVVYKKGNDYVLGRKDNLYYILCNSCFHTQGKSVIVNNETIRLCESCTPSHATKVSKEFDIDKVKVLENTDSTKLKHDEIHLMFDELYKWDAINHMRHRLCLCANSTTFGLLEDHLLRFCLKCKPENAIGTAKLQQIRKKMTKEEKVKITEKNLKNNYNNLIERFKNTKNDTITENDLKPNSPEKWKPIKNFEIYRISTHGNILNLKNGNLAQYNVNRDGYFVFSLYDMNSRSTKTIHRLVAQTFLLNPENKPQVNHLSSKTSNEVWNLEWSTSHENAQHAAINIIKPFTKKVWSICNKTKEKKLHNSVKEAAIFAKTKVAYISACLGESQKTTGSIENNNSYSWKYFQEKIKIVNLENEIWVNLSDSVYDEINKFDGYKASNLGRLIGKRNSILKTHNGSIRIVRKGNFRKTFSVHRLIVMAFNILPENVETMIEIDHIDSDHKNNKLSNLRWSTKKDNMNNPNTIKKRKVNKINDI